MVRYKDLSLQEMNHVDWSKLPKSKRPSFGVFCAQRQLKGWSFLGMSIEKYEAEKARIAAEENKWATENGKATQ